MRNAYEPAPWLAASNTPNVSSVTGLGTGGGASLQTIDSSGFGSVLVAPGKGYASNGSVALTFPGTPPTLFISGDEAFGILSQSTVGKVTTISWSGANFPAPETAYAIHYEWNVSD